MSASSGANILWHRAMLWAYGILCLLASVAYTKYDSIGVNRPVSLALVELLRDPTLYSSDPIRDTLFRYISVLWWIIAWLSFLFPLEPMEFALFLLFRSLLFYAAYRLARVLAPHSTLAVLSGMAVIALVPQPVLAEGTIMTSNLEQSSVAVPFVLLSFADLLSRKYWRSFFWLGVVANLTILYASYTLVFLAATLLLLPEYRPDWKLWARAGIAGALTATPVILLILTREPIGEFDVELWYKVNRFRSPHHFYPLAFSENYWMNFGITSGAVLLLAAVLRTVRPFLSRLLTLWFAVNLFFVCAAFLSVYAIRLFLVTSLQPARGVDLLLAPASVLVAVSCSLMLEEAVRSGSTARTLLNGAIWSLGLNLWSWRLHPNATLFLLISSEVALVAAVLRGWQKSAEARLQATSLLLAASLVLTLGVSLVRRGGRTDTVVRFAAHSPIYLLARWARENTPKEAVFLIPPGLQEDWYSFRALSHRGVFVTWKDGTHVLFAPRYTEEWVRRIAELGFDIRHHQLGLWSRSPMNDFNINELYFQLRDVDVQRIASRYRVDYWIVPVQKDSAFPEVFRHGKWKVLHVSPSAGAVSVPLPQRHNGANTRDFLRYTAPQ